MIWAVLAGGVLGLGLLMVFLGLPAMNRPQLTERVAPYLRSISPEAADSQTDRATLRGAAQLLRPVVEAFMRPLESVSIDSTALQRRLVQANLPISVADYRLQQMSWGLSAALVVLAANVIAALSGQFHLVVAVATVSAAAILGAVLRDNALSVRLSRRRQRMLAEFPAISEMLALAVSAGESAPGAFERIARTAHGELAGEFTAVVQQAKAGDSFTTALRSMSVRTDAAPVARFLEGVIVAVERGTPLADVLRAQAADVRELSKRELMETAGSKEIGMLVPVVFGILPLTVVFATYPALDLLNIGV